MIIILAKVQFFLQHHLFAYSEMQKKTQSLFRCLFGIESLTLIMSNEMNTYFKVYITVAWVGLSCLHDQTGSHALIPWHSSYWTRPAAAAACSEYLLPEGGHLSSKVNSSRY